MAGSFLQMKRAKGLTGSEVGIGMSPAWFVQAKGTPR
jgi:hypothetical protein